MTLVDHNTDTRHTIFSAILGVLGVLWLVQSANGLKVLLRRRSARAASQATSGTRSSSTPNQDR